MPRPLHIGITCYPSVGGSGVLAAALGEHLARRAPSGQGEGGPNHVHFISYERPFRLPDNIPNLHFHPVEINDYGLFKYPDYTLPLSVKMAEVTRDHHLDLLHVHYAVPHATAAILARDMLPDSQKPRIITTLHGTDTTLLGADPGYGPAICHALACSDAITTVSAYLKTETQRLLQSTAPPHSGRADLPIDVIHNFFEAKTPRRSRDQVRHDLGLKDELMLLHLSNLRPVKRIDLLLETLARLHTPHVKLVILAGDTFAPYIPHVHRLGLENRIIVREKVNDIEDYLQAADLGLFTSESESFCLSILELMCFGVPSVATCVGGIPEVVEDGVSGMLVHSADPPDLAQAVHQLLEDPSRRRAMGHAAQRRARERFSAEAIVPLYESLYRRVCQHPARSEGPDNALDK
jgi:L-malate glycosyltransferase